MTRTRLLLGVAAATALGCLAAGEFGWDGIRVALKPMPVACLAVWVGARSDRHARGIRFGLVLSFVADLVIEASFLAGLVAFLFAHIAYATAFTFDAARLRPWRALPVAALGFGATSLLWPRLGSLRGAVAVYVVALCAMAWRAAARVGHAGPATPAEWAGVAGAALFAVSDGLIAFDRFDGPLAAAGGLVLPLYWAGQLGIACSGFAAAGGPARAPAQSGW